MGTTILQAALSAPPRCEARTGYRAGEFTEEPLWCNGQRGLRSFTDVNGVTHWYCAAPRHRESVVRQHGPRAELERGTATFDAPDWDERKARMDAEMMADLELMADEFHGRIR